MKYKYNGQWYDISIKALDGMPIGAIIAYPSNNIPNGWLECNGSTITSANYPELYDLIGGTLPNLKGRVIVGQDISQTEFDTLGETGGSKDLQEHRHNLGGQAVASGGTYQQVQNTGMTGGGMWGPTTFGLNSTTTDTAGTGNSGNLQPYVVYKWIIKAKQTTPLIASVVNSNSDSTTDTYSCSYVNGKVFELTPVVLYNSSNGELSEVTLSSSTVNFSYIEIYYQKSGCYGYTKVFEPSGKQIALNVCNIWQSTTYQNIMSRWSISGNKITKEYEGYNSQNGTAVTTSNELAIMKVVGYN